LVCQKSRRSIANGRWEKVGRHRHVLEQAEPAAGVLLEIGSQRFQVGRPSAPPRSV
jgi:hypothetical protein